MSAHEIAESVTVCECMCGAQVSASSEQRAEELMAAHIAEARLEEVRAALGAEVLDENPAEVYRPPSPRQLGLVTDPDEVSERVAEVRASLEAHPSGKAEP
jgi:hypothetical protein